MRKLARPRVQDLPQQMRKTLWPVNFGELENRILFQADVSRVASGEMNGYRAFPHYVFRYR